MKQAAILLIGIVLSVGTTGFAGLGEVDLDSFAVKGRSPRSGDVYVAKRGSAVEGPALSGTFTVTTGTLQPVPGVEKTTYRFALQALGVTDAVFPRGGVLELSKEGASGPPSYYVWQRTSDLRKLRFTRVEVNGSATPHAVATSALEFEVDRGSVSIRFVYGETYRYENGRLRPFISSSMQTVHYAIE